MATLADLNVRIGAQIDDFERNMATVHAGIGRLGEHAKTAGQALTTYITLPLGLLGGASLKAAADIEALEKGFAATYKGSESLSVAMERVRELAKLPGLGLKEALQGATNLQAAGFSADLARRSLSAFGNALATVGKGKADLDGVGLALSQIASKGKISAEEINQLAERVPQIRQAMQAAFGTADTEALQKAKISATAFVEGVTKELEKLPRMTGGLTNAFENFTDAGTIALSKLGTSLNKTFGIEAFADRVSAALLRAADAFESLSPESQRLIAFGGVAVAALGPVVFALGAVAAAVPAVTAGMAALGVTSLAALGPVGIGAAAIAAAAYLIIDHWGDLVNYFTTGEGGQVFGLLADSVSESASESASEISAAFSGINSGGGIDDMVTATGILQQMIREVGVGFRALSDIVGGAVGAISRLLRGDLAGSAQQAERALLALIDPVANLLGFTRRVETFSQAGGAFGNTLLSMTAGLQSASDGLTGFAGGLPVYGAAMTATTGLTEKQINALAKLREELRVNGEQSLLLGSQYDFIGERQKILEGGVKDLLEKGFKPGGAILRDFAKELGGLNDILGDNARLVTKSIEGLAQMGQLAKKKINPLDGSELSENKLPTTLATIPVPDGEPARAAQEAITTSQQDFNTRMGELAEQFPVDAFMAIGDGIGAALGSGADVLRSVFNNLLSVVSDYMKEYGKQLLKLAVADLAIGNVGKGFAELAAGTALIAGAGFAASAISTPSTSSAHVGANSVASTPRSSFTPTVAPAGATQPGNTTHTVVVRMAGRELVGMLELETDRLGRIMGS